jgi:bacteriocin-like protein
MSGMKTPSTQGATEMAKKTSTRARKNTLTKKEMKKVKGGSTHDIVVTKLTDKSSPVLFLK